MAAEQAEELPLPGSEPLLVLANIRTNDPKQPVAEALLVRDGEIVAVGARSDLEAEAGAARRIDWRDATMLPGLTDAHTHLLGLGQAGEIVDLRGATSVAEIVARLREQAPPEGWFLGRGWDQNLWGGAMPSAAMLDEAFGDRPVWLRRIDGHAGLANSTVLRRAGIDDSTADPKGGEILRDPQTRAATGVLVDNAMDLVVTPPATPADIDRWLQAATHEAACSSPPGRHVAGTIASARDGSRSPCSRRSSTTCCSTSSPSRRCSRVSAVRS